MRRAASVSSKDASLRHLRGTRDKGVGMRRRPIALIVTLALGILSAPLAADAQQAGKVPEPDALW